jgi:hypothetical protein
LNRTADFLGPPERWAGARLGLRDVHGLWGGQRLDLDGAGKGWVSVVDRVGQVRRYEVGLDAGRVRALFEQVISSDLTALEFRLRPGQPDESRPVIVVGNAAGESRTISKWSGDHSPAFEAVYQALLRVVREAAGA